MDIGFDDFLASFHGALGPAGMAFQHVMEGLKPWLKAIQRKPG
jgi:hypothetical protein